MILTDSSTNRSEKIVFPNLFSKLALVPERFVKFDLRPRAAFKHDADHIKTIFHLADPENISINPCGSDDLALLSEIDGSGRFRKVYGTSRFHLDKSKHVPVESDQVYFACYRGLIEISADRDLKICGNDRIAAAFKIFSRKVFAALAKDPGR
jgi:hypothetical protein